jgi:hypothetical protein
MKEFKKKLLGLFVLWCTVHRNTRKEILYVTPEREQDTQMQISSIHESELTFKKQKSKAIPVTGRGDLKGCEMLRIPHCLDLGSPNYGPRAIDISLAG